MERERRIRDGDERDEGRREAAISRRVRYSSEGRLYLCTRNEELSKYQER